MAASAELTRTTLAVLFVAGLIAASFWIVWPFLPAIIWATTQGGPADTAAFDLLARPGSWRWIGQATP